MDQTKLRTYKSGSSIFNPYFKCENTSLKNLDGFNWVLNY
jgi:hypothetical protein